MKPRSYTIALVLGASMFPAVVGAQPSAAQPAPTPNTTHEYSCVARTQVCTLTISWHALSSTGALVIDDDYVGARKAPRTNARTSLTIRIVGFNYLRYQPKFTVEETEVAAYVTLETLWKQIFGLATVLQTSALVTAFNQAILDWHDKMGLLDNDVSRLVAGTGSVTLSGTPRQLGWGTNVALTTADVATIADSQPHIRQRLADMEDARANARAATASSNDPDTLRIYQATLEIHERTLAKGQSYLSLAGRAVAGSEKTIPKKKAGRFVTVKIVPTDADGAEQRSASVEYFVHSELPVSFHSGYSYSGLKDIDYEKVRAASGEELYSEVKKADETTAIVAFLSYDLRRLFPPGKIPAVFGTLGTDLSKPGERLYFGGSVGYRKIYFTLGAMSASVAETENKVVDKIVDSTGELLGTRDLFKTLSKRRNYDFFFSVSFNPFAGW